MFLKIFGQKLFLVGKDIWSKKNWLKNVFGRKKFLMGKDFGLKKNFGQKKFWSKKCFGQKKFSQFFLLTFLFK